MAKYYWTRNTNYPGGENITGLSCMQCYNPITDSDRVFVSNAILVWSTEIIIRVVDMIDMIEYSKVQLPDEAQLPDAAAGRGLSSKKVHSEFDVRNGKRHEWISNPINAYRGLLWCDELPCNINSWPVARCDGDGTVLAASTKTHIRTCSHSLEPG